MKKLFLVLFGITSLHFLSADELRLSEKTLRERGYRPFGEFVHPGASRRTYREPKKNLPWPVKFADSTHTIAQNFIEYQDYAVSIPYYHGGCDLRSVQGWEVKAPVDGILEGGYYGYKDKVDGKFPEKFWTPWSENPTSSNLYFELAVTDESGNRFEMHHVGNMTLPKATQDALKAGNVKVSAGTVLGFVSGWPQNNIFDYEHLHYNIVRPDKVYLNPEYFSAAVGDDHVAPEIKGVYGIRKDGTSSYIRMGGQVEGPLSEIIVNIADSRDGKQYVQPPPFIYATFADGVRSGWDFRKVLLDSQGNWPDLRQVFQKEIYVANHNVYFTTVFYGKGTFLMKIPATSARGKFSIQASDSAGNATQFEATIN